MPNKICLNNDVWERYYAGATLSDAISEVHTNEIRERIEANAKFETLTPLQMVMFDAGIKKTDKLEALFQNSSSGAYTSGGVDTNQWLFPAWVESTLREAMYGTDYLNYIVTTRQGIDGNTVQSPMLNLMSDENKRAIKKARVAELADIPTGKITIGEKAITLWKRGRAIEMSYEAARRMRIDLFAIQMRAIASDLARQEIDAAVEVAVNGDGNNGTGAIEIGSTTTANTISAKDITHALIMYSKANNFNASTIVVPWDYLESIASMVYDSQLVAGAMRGVSFNIPQISAQNVNVIGVDEVKVGNKNAVLFLNSNQTLIRYEENGSNIQEIDNFIRNQSRLMTLTENSGYAVGMAGSNMYMTIKSA